MRSILTDFSYNITLKYVFWVHYFHLLKTVLFVLSRKDRRQLMELVTGFVNSLLSGLYTGLVLALFGVPQAQEVPKFF